MTSSELVDVAPGFARVKLGRRTIGTVHRPDFRVMWNVKLGDGSRLGQAHTRKAAVDMLVARSSAPLDTR